MARLWLASIAIGSCAVIGGGEAFHGPGGAVPAPSLLRAQRSSMVPAALKCGDAMGSWQSTIACAHPIRAASPVNAVPVSTDELWALARLLRGHQRSPHFYCPKPQTGARRMLCRKPEYPERIDGHIDEA